MSRDLQESSNTSAPPPALRHAEGVQSTSRPAIVTRREFDLFGPEALRYGGSIVATTPVAHHDVETRAFGERPERRDPVPIKARLFDDGSDPHCPDRAPGRN